MVSNIDFNNKGKNTSLSDSSNFHSETYTGCSQVPSHGQPNIKGNRAKKGKDRNNNHTIGKGNYGKHDHLSNNGMQNLDLKGPNYNTTRGVYNSSESHESHSSYNNNPGPGPKGPLYHEVSQNVNSQRSDSSNFKTAMDFGVRLKQTSAEFQRTGQTAGSARGKVGELQGKEDDVFSDADKAEGEDEKKVFRSS